MVKAALPILVPLLLAAGAAAFGCQSISYTTCADRIVHWYDPDDGQICDPHDCGGGRAPPRKDVPGCAFYTGTETLKTEPSYLPCWKPSTAAVSVPTESSVKSSVESTPTDTGEAASLNETMTGSSAPASTTTVSVAPSTTASPAPSSVPGGGAAASPSTTPPATLSTTTPSGTTAAGNTTSNTATTSTHTGGAARRVGGPKMALVGGIVGGFALL